MLIIQTIKTAVTAAQTYLQEKAAYRELDKLDPYLLDDLGLRLEKGKIIQLHAEPPVPEPTPDETLRLVVDRTEELLSQQPPPQGASR